MRKSLDLVSGKQAFFQSAADTGIQRPSVFEELLLNKRDEIDFFDIVYYIYYYIYGRIHTLLVVAAMI